MVRDTMRNKYALIFDLLKDFLIIAVGFFSLGLVIRMYSFGYELDKMDVMLLVLSISFLAFDRRTDLIKGVE